MPSRDQVWVSLASSFPAGLDTETDPAKMQDGFSPDAYGMSIDCGGFLKVATCPTGSDPVKVTTTIGANTWTWCFRRLWRISTTNLLYNAPEYVAAVVPQGVSSVSFAEDTNDVVTFIPAWGGNMYVGKSTGGYILNNADSLDGDFQHGDIKPALKVAAATSAVTYNDIVYVSNGNGLMAWDGREVAELTLPVRTNVSTFQNVALKVDYQRGWIVGGSAFVYDTVRKRIYTYSGSSFRFTTRTLMDPKSRPFAVFSLRFKYDSTASGNISFQTRLDEGWSSTRTVELPYRQGAHNQQIVDLTDPISAHKFSMRLTSLSSAIGIREIEACVDANWLSEGWSQ